MTEQEGFKRLEKVIVELKDQNFFFIYNSIWRIIGVSLIQGLASGLGFVIIVIATSFCYISPFK